MIGSDIKLLFRKLNSLTTTALYDAVGLAVERSHYEVAFEHFLAKAMDIPSGDISLALDHFKVDRARLRQSLAKALDNFNAGNTGKPSFSPVLQDLLEASWLSASVDLGLSAIRSGSILVAYLRRPSLFAQGGPLPELGRVPREELEKGFFGILAGSSEAGVEPEEAEATGRAAGSASGESFTAKYCEDFSLKAARGKIDPVFGRDDEIRSMISILARRRKNNPILVGEAGVGKTAVIEGLAMRIHEGDVPETLRGVTLLSLDMGLLEAGASVKGEFERRLKGVIDEVKSSPKPVILFIDEAHMLVGAGGQAGGSDAANLLKPALARGELRTCAATTWKEYKKYFEKDPALARRFQLVSLDEPSVETCVLILRGLRDYYEKSHDVTIRDEAIRAAAEMSNRYISGRFLPDKAVDLIDTACARVKVGLVAKPRALEEAERGKAALGREKAGLERDASDGPPEIGERIGAIVGEIAGLDSRIAALTATWERQRRAAGELREAKAAYLALEKAREASPPSESPAGPGQMPEATGKAPETSPPAEAPPADPPDRPVPEAETPKEPEPPEGTVALEKALEALEAAKKAMADTATGDVRLDLEVTGDVVAAVVSDWTGIPVGRLAAEQAQMVSDLESLMRGRIKGQDGALAAIAREIQASKAGLRDPRQPIGVFLLVGPSGVGKTETGLSLADLLFGDERNVVTINMSEFQEKHTVSRLVGSPPGYVGYGEGGLLTEAVRQKPYCVVLLDEAEKAHLDVLNLFYQVFDKGMLTDAEGKKVGFANTVIMLTSNLGTGEIEREARDKPDLDLAALTEAIRPTLSRHFQPALLARMAVVPFRPLDGEALSRIARLKLETLAGRVMRNNGIRLEYPDGVVQAIADRCLTAETGARNIDHVLSSSVLPMMAQELLRHMTTGQPMPKTVGLSLAGDGSFRLDLGQGGGLV